MKPAAKKTESKLRERIERYERDELERENGAAEIRYGLLNLREQIDTLAVDVDTASAPKTFDQWRRCLQGMLRDEDWRHGTWR
jgi:hypothetical protein